MENDKQHPLRQQFIMIAVVVNYWVVSITMVFLNRFLLGGGQFALEAPIFITWLQCVVAVVACGLLGTIKELIPSPSFFDRFHPFQFDGRLMLRILPLSLAFAGMITFNNLCLKYVGVAFYNVGRSLTTVFNVLLTFLMLGSRVSAATLAACGTIVLGFLLGVDQEEGSSSKGPPAAATTPLSDGPEASSEVSNILIGVFFGVLSSFCVAINAVLTQTTVKDIKDNWLLAYYNNLNAVFILLPVILLMKEGQEIASHADLVLSTQFFILNLIAGLFGIGIALATMLQIQYTSPLTHNVSGTAKASFQTVVAVAYGDQQKSFLWWFSNALVLGGSFAYAAVKNQEMKQPILPPPPKKEDV